MVMQHAWDIMNFSMPGEWSPCK